MGGIFEARSLESSLMFNAYFQKKFNGKKNLMQKIGVPSFFKLADAYIHWTEVRIINCCNGGSYRSMNGGRYKLAVLWDFFIFQDGGRLPPLDGGENYELLKWGKLQK